MQKYSKLTTSKLRKLEVINKTEESKSDITFLANCKVFNIIPKFLAFNLPNTNDSDSRFIRKQLQQSALKKRKNEQYKLDK